MKLIHPVHGEVERSLSLSQGVRNDFHIALNHSYEAKLKKLGYSWKLKLTAAITLPIMVLWTSWFSAYALQKCETPEDLKTGCYNNQRMVLGGSIMPYVALIWSHGAIFSEGQPSSFEDGFYNQNNGYSTLSKILITSISWLTTGLTVYLGISAYNEMKEYERLKRKGKDQYRSTFLVVPIEGGGMVSWGLSF